MKKGTSQEEQYRVSLQAFDFYRRIEEIHRTPVATLGNLQAKYVLLKKVLEQACYEATKGVTLTFANLFSRLDYICKAQGMVPSDKYAIQTMRRHTHQAINTDFRPDMQEYLYDLRALVRFVSLIFHADVPAHFLPEMPPSNRPYQTLKRERIHYLRVSVTGWTEQYIYATTDSDDAPNIIIDYSKGGENGDLLYLNDLLTEHAQLNLLDVSIDEQGHYLPHHIVLHPDYLIDISSLAACFREYGSTPLNYFIQRTAPRETTAPILLGNLAGRFLDDVVHEEDSHPVSYKTSLVKFFTSNALEFCACDIPQTFHEQAGKQLKHIRQIIRHVLPDNVPQFKSEQTLLEASFICERLGLQGRVDMLQKDLSVLIEQKSGKRDEWRHQHKEDHFVQMMLYQGVLMHNFGVPSQRMHSFLLYSKYADGLMLEHFSETLFRQALHLRNQITAQEWQLAQGGITNFLATLTPDKLCQRGETGKLWREYALPQLERQLSVLQGSNELERAYYTRYFTFICKELLLNKTGGKADSGRGLAALWNLTVSDKIEAGNILMGLRIEHKAMSSPYKGYDTITLRLPHQGIDFLPNFRKGDMVIFYAYDPARLPDAREQILMRGNVKELSPERIVLLLRNGQQNPDMIGSEEDVFAIEHDISDTSASQGIRNLYTFLSSKPERRALLLGTASPRIDKDVSLLGEYSSFSPVVLAQKQTKDYFLLIGPPGTGKTSQALQYMVREALAEGENVLLLAYTNRAVDEICEMLTATGIANEYSYLRIGNELSCDERFVPSLLKNRLSTCEKLDDVRRTVEQTRIFVSTVTSMNGNAHLFTLKRFDVAFVDEASQVLEPDLVGILSAKHGEEEAIGRFVLIGDYKQLPAISLQSAEEAEITDETLRRHGFTDCRMSLFERLYRQSPTDVRAILQKQGRMHPDIAAFSNATFYAREKLLPVPLPHQEEALPYTLSAADEGTDGIVEALLRRRLLFVATEAPLADGKTSDKANEREARIVGAMLERIYRLRQSDFDPHKTVGVIVPYRNQIAMIRRVIASIGVEELNEISVDTVERYQGSQRDVILYSFTVRSYQQLNFLTAQTFIEGDHLIDRKLNVALTRARKQLILTGNPHLLSTNLTFYKLIEHVRRRGGYIDVPLDDFCTGHFSLPVAIETDAQSAAQEDALMERLQYGRTDVTRLHTAADVAAYEAYFWEKQYACACALHREVGGLFREQLRALPPVLYVDYAQESAATAFSFVETVLTAQAANFTYWLIQAHDALANRALERLRSKKSDAITMRYRTEKEITATHWANAVQASPIVIFNLSNALDRVPLSVLRAWITDMNARVAQRPYLSFYLLFREDTRTAGAWHTLDTCRAWLHPSLRPLHEEMPMAGKVDPASSSNDYLWALYSNRF